MRIAIVNDLLLAVEALCRVLRRRPNHTIAWIARDGAEAVRKCAQDRPDLILMDLIMPVMNGAEASRLIMRDSPCPILVVTATVDGNIGLVFEAMGYGALDAFNTPTVGPDAHTAGAEEFLRKIDLISHLIGPVPAAAPVLPPAPAPAPARTTQPPLIALGASTGGPAALVEILSRLPPTLPAPVLLIQHVDREFAADLATWLARHCHLPVKVAAAGARPERGVVWLAGTNDHLVLSPRGLLHYQPEPVDCFYRPSVDVCFKSLAQHWPAPGVAGLLTGMGRDGAQGLRELRQRGWRTIAQDHASSVVYGMPRAAAELQAAERVLPLNRIADALLQAIGVSPHY